MGISTNLTALCCVSHLFKQFFTISRYNNCTLASWLIWLDTRTRPRTCNMKDNLKPIQDSNMCRTSSHLQMNWSILGGKHYHYLNLTYFLLGYSKKPYLKIKSTCRWALFNRKSREGNPCSAGSWILLNGVCKSRLIASMPYIDFVTQTHDSLWCFQREQNLRAEERTNFLSILTESCCAAVPLKSCSTTTIEWTRLIGVLQRQWTIYKY